MTDAEWDALMAQVVRSREVLNGKLDRLAEQFTGLEGGVASLREKFTALAELAAEVAANSTLLLEKVTELAERKEPEGSS